jgi:hypothetical protein
MFFVGAEFFTHLSSIRRVIITKLGEDETKVIEIFEVFWVEMDVEQVESILVIQANLMMKIFWGCFNK